MHYVTTDPRRHSTKNVMLPRSSCTGDVTKSVEDKDILLTKGYYKMYIMSSHQWWVDA